MRIHYYMQFYPGDGSPGSQQPFALGRALAKRGHDVTVVAADYNIDSGLSEPCVDEQIGAGRLRVHRLTCPKGGRGSNRARLLAYLSFMMSALRHGRRLGPPNLVIGSIQPMFAGVAGLALAKRARAPFVLEVRDLWPDALVVKKAISSWQARLLHRIVNTLYRHATRIVSLTPGIKTELIQKGISSSKIDVFPNGWDPELFSADGRSREDVRAQFGWGEDFVAIYAGSFQTVTAVDVLVRAASNLKGTPGMKMVLFGAGPTLEKVKQLASELAVSAVEFQAPVPKKQIPGLLRAADVGLMALAKTPLAHIYFENKLMDYLGAGLPIVAAMEGKQADLIREAGCGVVGPPMDDQVFAQNLLKVANEPEARRLMGERGRTFVEAKLRLPDILDRYVKTVEDCARGEAASLSAWEPF